MEKIKSINKDNIFSYSKKLLIKVLFAVSCYILLSYSSITQQGIKDGIYNCVNILVPSLFPFMVLSSFAVNSNIFKKAGKITSFITRKLFYLPEYTAPIIILSLIGGYPVGAKGVKTLYDNKQINSEQLNRMMCFCVNSGPAFIISVVGSILLKNLFTGTIIFFIQILLSLFIGIFLGIKSKINHQPLFINEKESPSNSDLAENLVKSISSAAKSLLEICALVVIFSVLINVLQNLSNFKLFSYYFFNKKECSIITDAIIYLLEITSGCIHAVNCKAPHALLAFIIGHGGICAHLQIISILKNSNFKYSKFCFWRFINAILSYVLFYALYNILEIKIPAISITTPQFTLISNSCTAPGSVALILLCIYFIFSSDAKINRLFTK